MTITFYKYQGTGNDFIIIDNRQRIISKNDTKKVARLCDRKFGIGADGLMLLEKSEDPKDDFKMVYFNADGNESSMCGNGGRCLVAFAHKLGIITDTATFTAVDGKHYATIKDFIVNLQMQDVTTVDIFESHVFLDTGSPHHISLVDDVAMLDVVAIGKGIRNGAPYFETGTNVNFVEQKASNHYKVRTYERGVEDETLSCGTGVTAAALAMHATNRTSDNRIRIDTLGGELQVSFTTTNNGQYTDVILSGPAVFVFKGVIEW
ncbi:diaminopimelate epimerase [Aquimarina sp. W85]|uniref:diaminopimelate epimerase n=1 Tax=Aquimarina rhodophyticola TaxID=3342246 RepID=UPI00366DDE57